MDIIIAQIKIYMIMKYDVVISAPCAPSNNIECEVIECFKVTFEDGNFMYLKKNVPITDKTKQNIMEAEDIFGNHKRIGLRYVEYSETIKCVHDKWDVTEHANINEHLVRKTTIERWLELDENETPGFSLECLPFEHDDLNFIRTVREITYDDGIVRRVGRFGWDGFRDYYEDGSYSYVDAEL